MAPGWCEGMPSHSLLTRRSTTPTRAHGLRLQDQAQPMSARRCTYHHWRTHVHPIGIPGKACRHARGESLLHEALWNSVQGQSQDHDGEHHQTLLNPVPGEDHEGKEQEQLDEELLNPVLGENLEDVQHEFHGNSPLSSAMQS